MRWIVLGLTLMACATDGDETSDQGGNAASDAVVNEVSDAAIEGTDGFRPPPGDQGVERQDAGDPPTEDAFVPAPGLTDPSQANVEAPPTYSVVMTTSAGEFTIDVTRAWAPRGADRFYNLVRVGHYDDVAFFRVIDGFMAQTGINGDPAVSRVWRAANIDDDPNTQSNTRGRITFATAGPNTRTTQVFINFGDNSFLDDQGFSPFGEVRDMTAVDALYNGYGEGAPQGNGPSQGRIQSEGNVYLRADFPELDYILTARIGA